MESEEVSFEGDAQASVAAREGCGYPKVVKRTVLKSEGGHTEVGFDLWSSANITAFMRLDRMESFL